MNKKPANKRKSSNDEIKAFRRLNSCCTDLEEKLLREITKLNKTLLERVKSKNSFLYDFCIEIYLKFHLSDKAHHLMDDSDNSVGSVHVWGNFYYPYHKNGQWRYLDDSRDWNPLSSCAKYPFNNEKHCYLLAQLLLAMKPEDIPKILKIRSIFVEIRVSHQHVSCLSGKEPKSVKVHWPDITIDDYV